MIGVLVFANWAAPADDAGGLWSAVYSAKWVVAAGFGAVLLFAVVS